MVAPIVDRLGDNSWWRCGWATLGWVSVPFTTAYGICTGSGGRPPPSPTVRPGAPHRAAVVHAAATIQPPPATSTPGKSDLVIVSIVSASGSTTLTIPGGQNSVTQRFVITVSNTGSGPSGQFNNTVTVLPRRDSD
jgi:hypothetical protein